MGVSVATKRRHSKEVTATTIAERTVGPSLALRSLLLTPNASIKLQKHLASKSIALSIEFLSLTLRMSF